MTQPVPGEPASPSPSATEASAWNLPNALTVGRIVLVPVVGWLLLAELKIAATAEGSLHLGNLQAAAMRLQPLPYALPHESEAA